MSDLTIAESRAEGGAGGPGAGGGAGLGGGLFVAASGDVTLAGLAFGGDSAVGGAGGAGLGGGGGLLGGAGGSIGGGGAECPLRYVGGSGGSGQAFGTALFIQGDQLVTLAPGAGQTLDIVGNAWTLRSLHWHGGHIGSGTGCA